tara:strand:+ start:2489 stop:3196 length:708 start_codon:yes stop_codon:yes gene_type:complete
MMKAIRALTFDLDNTLWETDVSILRAEDAMARHLRSLTPTKWMANFNLEAFHAIKKEVVQEQPKIAHNLTIVRKETLKRWFENRGATKAVAEDLANEGFQIFYEERQNVTPYPGTVATLAQLYKNFKLAAITNGNADLMAMQIGRYFQFSLQSQHFPKPKPAPVMFEEALKRLKVDPHECIHVGDDIEHDVIGARQVGMKTVWFNTHSYIPEGINLADFVITDLRELLLLLKQHG